MSTKQTLEAAKARSEIVRVYREGLEDGWADGFVAGLGPDFFALELIDKAMRLDGFNCLRYEDISDCIAPAPYVEFMEKALRARRQVRRDFPVDLGSLPALLLSAANAFPLVSIFFEGDEGVCYIGRVVSVTEVEVHLLEISPDARWDSAATSLLLDGITRVDVGDAYAEALNLVAAAN